MSKADFFLKKTLGTDFLESLQKFDLWKPGTKSVIDHEELRTALQIVPRTVIALLIRELTPMKIGETKEIMLPVAENALLRVTKHERDVYSGEIEEANKKIVDFKLRALPGVGLVIMSAFELYNMDNLLNSDNEPEEAEMEDSLSDDANSKIQRLIDERLSLHSLIGEVVDKKIMQKEAIHQLVLAKLTEAIQLMDKKVTEIKMIAELARLKSERIAIAPVKLPEKAERIEKGKKKIPLQEFLEKRKPKEFSIHMAKSETFECPDCKGKIFENGKYSGCICYGDCGKLFIKKSEGSIKLRFGRGWDEENIEMLLEVLQKKNK